MKRLVRIGIVSLGAAVVLLAAFHYMRAQGELSSNAVSAPQPHSAIFVTNGPSSKPVSHDLQTTYFTQGLNVGIPETAYDSVAVDNPTTFKCCYPKGCTLEIEQSMQVGGVSYVSNLWAPIVKLDGGYLAYSPWVGETPTDGFYVLATSNQSIQVTPGTHTVQSFVISIYGLNLYNFHINYRVYVP